MRRPLELSDKVSLSADDALAQTRGTERTHAWGMVGTLSVGQRVPSIQEAMPEETKPYPGGRGPCESRLRCISAPLLCIGKLTFLLRHKDRRDSPRRGHATDEWWCHCC